MDVTDEVTAEFLQAFAEAWNRHDIDALMSFMMGDCVFESSDGTRYEGHQAVRVAFSGVWEAFPDAHWRKARHFVCGNRGVSEWIFTGTDADSTRVEEKGCDLFTFQDGKIAFKDTYLK